MGALSTVAALFVITIAAYVSCDDLDDVVVMPLVVQYQLLSMHSGKFVGVTTGRCLHAMGDIRGWLYIAYYYFVNSSVLPIVAIVLRTLLGFSIAKAYNLNTSSFASSQNTLCIGHCCYCALNNVSIAILYT